MQFDELSEHLRKIIDATAPHFDRYSNSDWAYRYAPGKWTRLEIVGHLVDSACNNHQRFVRALSQDSMEGPGYAQDDHVRVQRFAGSDPKLTVALFQSFNRHLAWLLDQFPPEKLSTPCIVAAAPPMTLEVLALDYVAHAEHHLRQILGDHRGEVTWSGMPWPPEDPSRQWPA